MTLTADAIAIMLANGMPAEAIVQVARALEVQGHKMDTAERREDDRRRKDRERKRVSRLSTDMQQEESLEIPRTKPSPGSSNDITLTSSFPSSSSVPSDIQHAKLAFADFWSVVPRKTGKDAAERVFLRIVKSRRAQPAEILIGAIRWRDEAKHQEPQFVPYPATWLNRGGWDDEPRPQAAARDGPAQPRPIDGRHQVLAELRARRDDARHQHPNDGHEAEPANAAPVARLEFAGQQGQDRRERPSFDFGVTGANLG